MTESEKIIRHDTLMTLRQRIGGCFGCADGIFAGHKSDEIRAKELRKLAFDNQVTLTEIQELALGYLFNHSFVGTHIKEQVEKVTKFFNSKIQ